MEKISYTLFNNFKYYFLHYFCPVIIAALIIYIIFLIIDLKKNQSKFTLKALINKRLISLFTFSFYIFFVLQATLFDRLFTGQRQDPLCNIFGEWIISESKYYYNLSPIWNIFLFLPISAVFVFFIRNFKRVEITSKLILNYTLISLAFSLFIEAMQIITKLGTFQISDLVYNTLGGFLGSLIFVFAVKIRNKKRRKPND